MTSDEDSHIGEDIDKLETLLSRQDQLLDQIQAKQEERKTQIKDSLLSNVENVDFEKEHIDAFLNQPYKILPRSGNEAYVVAPRFIPFKLLIVATGMNSNLWDYSSSTGSGTMYSISSIFESLATSHLCIPSRPVVKL